MIQIFVFSRDCFVLGESEREEGGSDHHQEGREGPRLGGWHPRNAGGATAFLTTAIAIGHPLVHFPRA